MNVTLLVQLLLATWCSGAGPLQEAPPAARQEGLPLSAELATDRLVVRVGDELLTEYRFGADQKYPYFFPVVGPLSGTSVTTESSEPYPHHHSLFFGCDRVNGGNYWQQEAGRGQIVQTSLELAAAAGDEVAFTTVNRWVRPDVPEVFEDTRRVRIRAPSATARWIDFDITLTALVDVRIEKNNHALFSARMVPELAVTGGGTLLNAQGESGELATFGKRSPWMDCCGEREGVVEGLAILCHPANRWSPQQWFTRDYGFFSPTPMFWLTEPLEIPRGERLRLRYRVVVHGGTSAEAGIAELYEQWSRAAAAAEEGDD